MIPQLQQVSILIYKRSIFMRKKSNHESFDLKHVLSSRIKEARLSKGLTQPELARLINSTDRNVSNYETGYSFPSIKILYSMSTALSTSVDYLLGLTDDPTISKTSLENNLTKDDLRLLDQLKNDEELYQFLAQNPKKGIQYIYKIWKLMDKWKKE